MRAPDPATVIDRLRSATRDLVALTGSASAERLQKAPEQGQWPAAMVLAHLADAELVYSVRVRMVLTGDRPYLAPYDEQRWVTRFAELETDPKQCTSRWRALRDANLRLFVSLDDAEWKLTGLHGERGEQSVLQLATSVANHDREHLDQIRKALSRA